MEFSNGVLGVAGNVRVGGVLCKTGTFTGGKAIGGG